MQSTAELLKLLQSELPIIQAPMAAASGPAMAIAAAEAGALGSLPCGMLTPAVAREHIAAVQQATNGPLNFNFFCHEVPAEDQEREAAWRARLAPYYTEFGIDADATSNAPSRTPFDDAMCSIVEEFKPQVVSFHFGLPSDDLLERVKSAGATVLSSATTVREAVWLAERGCEAIIAQGYEAGGHRGNFLDDDTSTQPGTFALVPQVVDAVNVPVIATGGISDGRGIAAALALGAAGVQIGTAYLLTPEATISEHHRAAMRAASDENTALTNVFSGRPARGLMNRSMRELGPMSDTAPDFPYAGNALAPLKSAAEKNGSGDFSNMWAGQSAALAREMDTATLTAELWRDAQELLRSLDA